HRELHLRDRLGRQLRDGRLDGQIEVELGAEPEDREQHVQPLEDDEQRYTVFIDARHSVHLARRSAGVMRPQLRQYTCVLPGTTKFAQHTPRTWMRCPGSLEGSQNSSSRIGFAPGTPGRASPN